MRTHTIKYRNCIFYSGVNHKGRSQPFFSKPKLGFPSWKASHTNKVQKLYLLFFFSSHRKSVRPGRTRNKPGYAPTYGWTWVGGHNLRERRNENNLRKASRAGSEVGGVKGDVAYGLLFAASPIYCRPWGVTIRPTLLPNLLANPRPQQMGPRAPPQTRIPPLLRHFRHSLAPIVPPPPPSQSG